MDRPTFVDTVTVVPADFLNLVAAVVFGPLNQATTVAAAQQALNMGTLAQQNAGAVAITGGVLDGVGIGNTTPSSGKFATLYSYQTPTDPNHAANKNYVDAQITSAGMNPGYLDNNFLKLSGGTLTGPLTLAGGPQTPQQAANKSYVDTVAQGFVTQASLIEALSDVAAQSYVNTLFAQQVSRQIYHDSYTATGSTATFPLQAVPSGDVMVWVNGSPLPKNQVTINTATKQIILASNPTGAVEVMYFSATGTGPQFTGLLPLTGGVLTGPLTLANDPVHPLDAATKEYVDSHASGVAPGTPTAQIINGVGVAQQLVINPFNGPAQFVLTLTQPTCIVTFAAQTVPSGYPANSLWSFSIMLKQGTGSNTISWPANVIWENGTPPTLASAAGHIDVIRFRTDPLAVSPTWLAVWEGTWPSA